MAKKRRQHKAPPRPSPALQEVWDGIPQIACQGKCADFCGPVDASIEERALMKERSGRDLGVRPPNMTCCHLSQNGRCTVYGVRPTVCRLWGVTPEMPCPHGCEVERMLTTDEAIAVLADSMEAGGRDPNGVSPDVMRAFLENASQADRQRYKLLVRHGPPEESPIESNQQRVALAGLRQSMRRSR